MATASAARSIATRSKSSSRFSSDNAISRPQLEVHAAGRPRTPRPRRPQPAGLLRVHVGPGAQRQVVARRPAHVVDERPAGVLEHDRVLHGQAQLGEDLGHAAPAQDQLGEAPVDLLPAREQRELGVDHGRVHGLGDLDEAHQAVEGDHRHTRPRAARNDGRRHVAPGRPELHGQRPRPARPASASSSSGATDRPPGRARRRDELAALQQIVRVGHLDHVRPADLAVQSGIAHDDLEGARRITGSSSTSARLNMTFCQS